jgi:hypothetical protein
MYETWVSHFLQMFFAAVDGDGNCEALETFWSSHYSVDKLNDMHGADFSADVVLHCRSLLSTLKEEKITGIFYSVYELLTH